MIFVFFLFVAIIALLSWVTARRKVVQQHNMLFRNAMMVSGAISVLAVLLAFSQFFSIIPVGHVGVVDFFGIVSDRTLSADINLVNPMAKIQKFSIQTKEHKEHKEVMQVLSREGLTIGLEISALYRLNPDSAARVYKTIAEGDYETIVLIPQFRSMSRAITASCQASALCSTERERLGEAIMAELSMVVSPRGIIIEATPLRNVGLPSQLTEAIEQKQRADQESQRMEFI